MAKNESIGFIGLGMMGKPMAENLLAAGYRLRVFNRSSDKAASLAESGATVVSAPEDAAETGGIVMSCVADDAALEAVVGRSGELAERLGKGGVHVSMSTVLPETADTLSRRHVACGGYYVAAPIMGRPDVVSAGKQSYYVAGHATAKDGRQILDAAYRTPLFKLTLGSKDIRLITRTADVSGTPMRFASVLKDRFLAAAAHGRSDYDWTGIAAEIRDEAGL